MSTINVKMVEPSSIQVLTTFGHLGCINLGSCVAIALLDPGANVGGLAHILLPAAFGENRLDRVGKFAVTAIPELIREMMLEGASDVGLRAAVVGGAQILHVGGSQSLDLGHRNVAAVMEVLAEAAVQVIGQDTGGTPARTLTFDVETGVVYLKTLTKGDQRLCCLRD